MTEKDKYHNKPNILDSSWGRFVSMLKLKAESAGVKLIEVNPMNTTKTCSKCGNIQEMPTDIREYKCKNCGTSFHRDYNSAINILRIALGQGFVENHHDSKHDSKQDSKQEAPCVS